MSRKVAVITDIEGEVVAVIPIGNERGECLKGKGYTLRFCDDDRLVFLPIRAGDRSIVRCQIKPS